MRSRPLSTRSPVCRASASSSPAWVRSTSRSGAAASKGSHTRSQASGSSSARRSRSSRSSGVDSSSPRRVATMPSRVRPSVRTTLVCVRPVLSTTSNSVDPVPTGWVIAGRTRASATRGGRPRSAVTTPSARSCARAWRTVLRLTAYWSTRACSPGKARANSPPWMRRSRSSCSCDHSGAAPPARSSDLDTTPGSSRSVGIDPTYAARQCLVIRGAPPACRTGRT